MLNDFFKKFDLIEDLIKDHNNITIENINKKIFNGNLDKASYDKIIFELKIIKETGN